MRDGRLGMFAKYWRPGAVKTRLAETIGEDAAAQVHSLFVRHLAERMADLADRCELWCSPATRLPEFQAVATGWTIFSQGGGDLGQRMARFFNAGSRPAVLIGSDSPNLPRRFVRDALTRLRDAPVVLGPAEDGGYYLIGVAEEVPPIFEDMPWSRPELWTATQERLSQLRIQPTILPTWYDVDRGDDLARLMRELSISPAQEDASLLHQLRQLPIEC